VRYLEVDIDGTTLSPRLALTSVPYALRSAVAERVEWIDTSVMQARVVEGCAPGSFMQSIAEDGTISCGPDMIGGGNIGGPYLPLGPTLSCDGTDKVTGVDPSSGSVICEPDEVTSYAAGSGLSLTGDTFSVRFGRSDDPRLTDARTPLAGSASYIQNQSGAPQAADLNISGQAIAGSVTSGGNIISPRFRALKLMNASTNVTSLPLSAGFTTSGGTLVITASGSGFASAANAPTIIGMNILVDGVNQGVSRSFTNEASSHKAFVTTTIVLTGVAAGNHTVQLTALTRTTTDFNDFFDVSVLELPF
jgi:hypothetical protein